MSTAIYGASGYSGGELIRLVDGHPEFDVAYLGAHATAGSELGEVHPHLPGGDRRLGTLDPDAASGVDLAFIALPPGASAELAVRLLRAGVAVVDLGSDFRMDTPARYESAYPDPHPHPEELGTWAYGLPELFRSQIAVTRKTAAPGCYPTSVVLALAPLLRAGVVAPDGIVVNSVSGVSGAGRSVKASLTFGAVAESVRPYGINTHRHRPEMERALEAATGIAASIVFTPHLVPMQRGLLSTITARLTGSGAAAVTALRGAYTGEAFVDVVDEPPQTRWTIGSNRCLISVHPDERSGTVVVVATLDNLVKGAAGQAVQCANLMMGLAETSGLGAAGWMP